MSDRYEKVDSGWSDAIMMLPPSPVFLLSVGKEDKNITTVGMFNVFSFLPLTVGIGITTARHSYKLLRQTDDFTLNVPGKELIDAVKLCGEVSGSRMAKFEETGLTSVPGKRVDSPKIRECLINIECKKMDQMRIGDHEWFLGEVVHADIVTEYDKRDTILYWGGEYWSLGEILESTIDF
jgi:flavin reductase (DIM6/NTAB) family NADH-FMN oxidoreductase RutF